MALAASFGLAMAITLHFFDRTLRPSVYPLLIASQAVPIVLLAPVLVLWLGFGLIDKLVVIAIVSFFAFVVTTLGGLSSVDPELIKLMRTLDASRRQIFRFVELPAALPGLLTGRQDRRRVCPHRGGAGRAGRLERRPRLRAPGGTRAISGGPHVGRRAHPGRVCHRPVCPADPGRAADRAVGPPTSRRPLRDEKEMRPGALRAADRPASGRLRREVRVGDGVGGSHPDPEPDAGLVPQRRPRRALSGHGRGRFREGRPARRRRDARRIPRSAPQARGGGEGRSGDLL